MRFHARLRSTPRASVSARLPADGYGQLEARALSAARLGETSLAAHLLYSLADDGEAEARAALPRREERLPDALAEFARDAGAAVRYDEQQPFNIRARGELDVAAVGRGLKRVKQKVRERVAN